MAALLSGQKKRATDAATIVPKTEPRQPFVPTLSYSARPSCQELPESFPDTHQNESTQQQQAQAPLRQQRSRISRKRPIPWELRQQILVQKFAGYKSVGWTGTRRFNLLALCVISEGWRCFVQASSTRSQGGVADSFA